MYKEVENLRWFMLPSEALDVLQTNGRARISDTVPFTPKIYELYRHRDWSTYIAQQNAHVKSTAGILREVLNAMRNVRGEAAPGVIESQWLNTASLKSTTEIGNKIAHTSGPQKGALTFSFYFKMRKSHDRSFLQAWT